MFRNKRYLDRLSQKVNETVYNRFLKETTVSMVYKSKNIFVMGKYLKLSRFMSQTPWEIEGVKLVN